MKNGAKQITDIAGDDAVTISQTWCFNTEVLERNKEAIMDAVKNINSISDQDKMNLLELTTKYSVSKE